MKKKSSRMVLVAALAVLLCCLGVFLIWQRKAIHSVVAIEAQANNVYDRTLKVVGDIDYDPYTFIDETGALSGHDIEMLYILADSMGYNTEIRLMPWGEALEEVRGGKADIILSLAETTNDEFPELLMSIPLVNDPFVAFGKKPFTHMGDLMGKQLAVQANTGCVYSFIEPYRLEDDTSFFASTTEAFEAARYGRADYAIARYSVGRRAIAHMDDAAGITAVGPNLLNNYMCIGVRPGAVALLAELDAAISGAYSDGTVSALSEKWLGHYVQTLTFGELLKENYDKLLVIFGLITMLFLLIFLIVSRAMSRRKEAALKKLAERDLLTGLYNRSFCEKVIQEALEASDPRRDIHALLVLDLDDFKAINDNHGHMVGDAALAHFAAGLTTLFRAGDIIGRLGGDEFFVFMSGCTDVSAPERKAEHIFDGSFDLRLPGVPGVKISSSIGISMYPKQGLSFTALYKTADEALYEAKRRGKGGIGVYGDRGELEYIKLARV